MRGVRRVSIDRADTSRPRNDRQQLKQCQLNTSMRNDEICTDGLSDQFVIDVGPEDELSWARDGVQESQSRKLKQGLVPFGGSLDLHGMSVGKARQAPQDSLAEATRLEIRCVHVTHGKAACKDRRSPLVKGHVNTRLRQYSQVLGLIPCLPRHDDTSSVYMMLCRTTLEGHDEQPASAESCQRPGGVLPFAPVTV